MNKILAFCLLVSIVLSSCSQSYYIVRHAEKATQASNMSGDVPLTDKGKARADALKEVLKSKKIASIYSTNTIRTKSTAQPTADYFQVTVQSYGPRPDSAFASLLRHQKKNILVVGHSNTVDDLVNLLCGETKIAGDLPETAYDNLFLVKKKGKKMVFSRLKYGNPSE